LSLVLASLRAEWLKLSKRPAVWVLAAVLIALVAVLTYGVVVLLLAATPANANLGPGLTAADLKRSLHPAHFVQQALGGAAGTVGGSIALILGVLGYGSEYGWGTLKTVFTQGPGRAATLAGKVGVLAALLLIYVAMAFAACAGCAAAVGAADGALIPWPSLPDVLKGLLGAWLIVGMWGGLGMLLSVLFRQSALAIGLGLIYAVVLEGLLLNLAAQFSFVKAVSPAFPGANARALVRSFGSAVQTAAAAATPAQQVGPGQAVLVLAVYAATFLVITGVLLRVRDVT
jgi:ABC-type transport system involved in multi-copper enzyme maturation permease subunit